MCVCFLAIGINPEFPLILAANRDEFFDRPARPAHFWPAHPDFFAGQDLQAGGTWFGVTQAGRWALVMNFRLVGLPENPEALSRGSLVTDFVFSQKTDRAWLEELSPRMDRYRPFNLLVGDLGFSASPHWVGYREPVPVEISRGIHGFSNGPRNADWPKVRRGREKISEILRSYSGATEAPRADVVIDELIALLRDEARAPDEVLPDTGVGLARERELSSIFVRVPEKNGEISRYGTRASSVLLVDQKGNLTFREVSYGVTGEVLTVNSMKSTTLRTKNFSS
ncbi:MAG: NRDE family protein [Oligoflexia bacterium]|nr:NRDE family protein [Oligoflexia bacterium]